MKLKVGDRVRVYGGFYAYQWRDGVITEEYVDRTLTVRFEHKVRRQFQDEKASSVEMDCIHPKQCRRLVPKKKERACFACNVEKSVRHGIPHDCGKAPMNSELDTVATLINGAIRRLQERVTKLEMAQDEDLRGEGKK